MRKEKKAPTARRSVVQSNVRAQEAVECLSTVSGDLVQRAQACGDTEAVNELLRKSEGIVRKMAGFDGCRSKFDMDDRMQEARIGIWRQAIPKYDSNRGVQFTTLAWWWARSAVFSLLKKETRHRRLRVNDDVIDALDHAQTRLREGQTRDVDQFETTEAIHRILECLTDEEQWILHYRFWADLSVREIAKISGKKRSGLRRLNRQTVCDITHKALAKMREALEQ